MAYIFHMPQMSQMLIPVLLQSLGVVQSDDVALGLQKQLCTPALWHASYEARLQAEEWGFSIAMLFREIQVSCLFSHTPSMQALWDSM